MNATNSLRTLLALGIFLVALSGAAMAEDRNWDPTIYGTQAAPVSWYGTSNWLEGSAPVNGQSVAHANSCCNPEPWVDINNNGLGVNLPGSTIRFDAKTNIVDSVGSDDYLVADVIRFNGAGGASNDVYVPVTANTFTSNRHGAKFHAPITVDTILANSGHQDRWEINVSPTNKLTHIELDENRGPDGGNIDGYFAVNADLHTATLDHIWSNLRVGAGATLEIDTYNLADYSHVTDPDEDNPNPITLDGDILAGQFNFGPVGAYADQGHGTWGAVGSGADNEVDWITGQGLLTVADPTPPPPPPPAAGVPEPSTFALAAIALVAGFFVWRRRR